ncbi:MAG: MoxR family ATPase [Firmicutes bacterium]|nr:MoxR family ATPase [Bacillota bacterium]
MDIKLVLDELEKCVSGKRDVMYRIIMCIVSGGHVVLEDKPGVGKTTIAKAVSIVMGLRSNRIQFNSDTMPSDVTGYVTYNKNKGCDEFVPGPIFGANLLLADEINRASSKCQAALLEVMQERQATVGSVARPVEDPFSVIATMNPYISAAYGVSVLPQSELDRFSMALSVGYPSDEDEIKLLKARDRSDPMDSLEPVCGIEDILACRAAIDEVFVAPEIYRYALALAKATRKHRDIEIGVSPRGVLVMLRLAKTRACFEGRDYVVPADIAEVFPDVCVHRISTREQELTVISEKRFKLLSQILGDTPAPRFFAER